MVCKEKSNKDCATYTTVPKTIALGSRQGTLVLNGPDGPHEAACTITPQPDVMVSVYDGDQLQYVCGPGYNIGNGQYDMECGMKLAPHYHYEPQAQEDLVSCHLDLSGAQRSQSFTGSTQDTTTLAKR